MLKKQIEPSLLAFQKELIPCQLKALKKIGIKTIHYDVMDGYVNNKAYDNEWIQPILDSGFNTNVHLMVFDPIKWVSRFCKFPIYTLTFQFEALTSQADVLACLKAIRDYKVKAGIAIKPGTSSTAYESLLKSVDIVTIMTVEPGKGGQSFMPSALKNLQYVFEYRAKHHLHYLIEVDGGIKLDNYLQVIDFADYIISGTGFMHLNEADQKKFIEAVENYKGVYYDQSKK